MRPDGQRLVPWATAGLSVAVALCLLTASCDDDDGSSSLRLPPGDVFPAISGLPVPTVDAPISIGAAVVVCLSEPGVATIVAVHPVEGTETFEIQDFATRPNPSLVGEDQLGEKRGTLQKAGFDPDAHDVDAVCDDGGSGYELGVQLARTGPGPAFSHGFDIDWESGENSGRLRIPLSVILCDARTAQIPRCDLPARDS
jgi:hypothetical protein